MKGLFQRTSGHGIVAWLVVAISCLVGQSSAWATDDPCVGRRVPDGETWRFVFLVDGSSSMSEQQGGEWKRMLANLRQQIPVLPDGAEVEIKVFFGTFPSGGRGRSSAKFLDPSLFQLDQKLVGDGRARLLGGLARLESDRNYPNGQTPLYHSIVKTIDEQEAWLRSEPDSRALWLYMYTDGGDGPGYDRFGNEVGESSPARVDRESVEARVRRLERREGGASLRFVAREFPIGVNHQGAGIAGIEPVGGGNNIIPIPMTLSAELASTRLAPPRAGRVSAEMDLVVQCPEKFKGRSLQVFAQTAAGQPLEVEPNAIPLEDGPIELSILAGDLDAATLASGFSGRLILKYPPVNPQFPLVGPTSVDFAVAPEDPVVDPATVRWRPQLAIKGQEVRLECLSPLVGATPRWTRADGGRVEAAGEWRASTTFDEVGPAEVSLVITRNGQASEPYTFQIPVEDVRLSVNRLGNEPLVAGDSATVEVEVDGSLEPSAFEWRVAGVLAVGESKDRLTTPLRRSGTIDIEVRGQVDVGGGESFTTEWFKLDPPLEVDPRPALWLQVPAQAAWGRPLPVQVLVDGGERVRTVRVSLLDEATGETVGASVESPVLNAILPRTGEQDRFAAVDLSLPEREGRYLVRAEAVELPSVAKEVSVLVGTPPLEVTLEEPPLLDRITVGRPRGFRLVIGDLGARVIERISWSVRRASGEPLSVDGVDQPSAPDARGLRAAEFDVLLPDDGSVSEGETLLVTPVFETAGGVRLEPQGGVPTWRLTAAYPGVTRSISASPAAVQVDWGETVVFSVTPPDRIASIDWSVTGPNGRELVRARGDQLEIPFDGPAGEYRIRATVQPDIPNAAPDRLEAIRTVTVTPLGASVEFPEGREGRGERLFVAVVSVSGSVRSGMLVLTSGEGDAAEERRIPIDLTPGSTDQVVETSSGVYGPLAVGEIGVAIELEEPGGNVRTIQAGSLNHRSPQEFLRFGLTTFVTLILLGVFSRLLLGNGFLRWSLDVRRPGKESWPESLVGLSKSGSRSLWKKSIRFSLHAVSCPDNTSSAMAWFDSLAEAEPVELFVHQGGRLRDARRFPPAFEEDPSHPVTMRPIADAADRTRDAWLRIRPRGGDDSAGSLEISVDASNDGVHWPFAVLWLVAMIAGVAGILAAWQAWMA